MSEESITIEKVFQIRCPREDLLLALQAADAVVPSNNANPIVNNLKLAVDEDHLEVLATDTQVGLRAVVRRIEINAPGQVIIPARQLVSILKESGSTDVHMHLDSDEGQQRLQIKLSDGDYNLPIIASDTFPTISQFPDDNAVLQLPAAHLDSMIKQTSFAVDRDRTSAVLSGVYLAARDGEFILAATDGKVLAESVDRNEQYGSQDELQAIIPAITINHMSRLLSSNAQNDVDLSVQKKLIFIRTSIGGGEGGSGSIQIELSSRLVEGSYPAYRNAIAANCIAKVSFKTKDLLSGVRRTALMTSAASRGIVLQICPTEAVLSNLNHTAGSARIPIKCSFDGGSERLGLNAAYLSEVLKAINGDTVTIELNGPGKGLIIRNESSCFLIMPITLPN